MQDEFAKFCGRKTSPHRVVRWIALYEATFHEFPNLLAQHWEYFYCAHGLQFLLDHGYQLTAYQMWGAISAFYTCANIIDLIGTMLILKRYHGFSEADRDAFTLFQSLWDPNLEAELQQCRDSGIEVPQTLKEELRKVADVYRSIT
jgi:hypothetical protein